ncbi:MAG: flagellar hook basal-body protein [Legionellaceae bacterium]|nr:flagellar hook basal-body protein [Legionellaceae bacterium]
MIDAISSAQLAMNQDQLELSATSQNISNLHTPAYPRSMVTHPAFETFLTPHKSEVLKRLTVQPLLRQGVLDHTRQALDFAIRGEGFFVVQAADGLRYTRRGDFHLNPRGELVSHDGYPVLGKGGLIHLDHNLIKLKADGSIYQDNRLLAQLTLVHFPNGTSLRTEGAGYFSALQPGEPIPHHTEVKQGFLEQSNVKSVEEMMEMLRISRHFQSSQRIMRTADELLNQAIRQLGEGS